MIIVSGKIFSIYKKIMIFVQLPEFAINDIKVLVAEEIRDLVDIILFLQKSNGGQQVGSPQLT